MSDIDETYRFITYTCHIYNAQSISMLVHTYKPDVSGIYVSGTDASIHVKAADSQQLFTKTAVSSHNRKTCFLIKNKHMNLGDGQVFCLRFESD